MGCDVHLHVEYKVDDVWRHYGLIEMKRDYDVFHKIGGVRGRREEEQPLSHLRGIPDDATFETKFHIEEMGIDAQMPTWLAHEEIDALSLWVAQTYRKNLEHDFLYDNYFFGHRFTLNKDDMPKWLQSRIKDLRWVLWFDNV